MKYRRLPQLLCLFLLIFCLAPAAQQTAAQKLNRIDRERMTDMLKNIKNAIEDDYYDPKFRGIDLDTKYDHAKDRLKQVESVGQAMAVISQFLMDFNDSHLYFLPPATNLDVEYGWRLKMYGDKCYITLVKPESDAAAQGLKPGDQVLSIEGFRPSRSELWKMKYYYNVVSKRSQLKMTVLSPGAAAPRTIQIKSEIDRKPYAITRQTFWQLFDWDGRTDIDYNLFVRVGDIAVWKMPSFAIEPANIDTLVGKIRDSRALILDLRGNGGGYVKTLERLAGYMFEKDLTIASLIGREEMDPQTSKTMGDDVYKGQLIVLLDHNSGSAAEIFARLVQLEKRGRVVGDISSGSVMQSRPKIFTMGGNDEIIYGASITNADVVMADGKSLENVGVVPDELVLPDGGDIAADRDPVLARAVELLGGKISAKDAGKFFRYEWKGDKIIIKTK